MVRSKTLWSLHSGAMWIPSLMKNCDFNFEMLGHTQTSTLGETYHESISVFMEDILT
jgi:hypothetical protein